MSPDQGQKWYQVLLPIAQTGGPVLTMALVVVMCVSTWWFAGWLRECADRNRLLGERLVTQQQAFHSEILVHLSRCAQPPR